MPPLVRSGPAFDVRHAWWRGEWHFCLPDLAGFLLNRTDGRGAWAELRRNHLTKIPGLASLIDRQADVVVFSPHPGEQGDEALEAGPLKLALRIAGAVPSEASDALFEWLIQKARIDPPGDHWLDEGSGGMGRRDEVRRLAKQARTDVCNQWRASGVRDRLQFARLTDTISVRAMGLTTAEHKKKKGIKSKLRDHYSTEEAFVMMTGEQCTCVITHAQNAHGFDACNDAARAGGDIAGEMRRGLERELGRPIVTGRNALPARPTDTQLALPLPGGDNTRR